MIAALSELLGLQVEGAKFVQADRTNPRELVEELWERFPSTLFEMTPAVEFVEGLGFAVLENATCAREPVFLVGVNKMTDHVGDGECPVAFVAAGPAFGEVTQEVTKSGGRALEKCDRIREDVGHRQGMLQDSSAMQKEKSATSVPLRMLTGVEAVPQRLKPPSY